MSKRLLVLAVVSAVVAGAAGWMAMRRTEVSVAVVVRGTAIDAIYASGPVRPVERVEIKARVSGPVGEIFVREGHEVKKGDRLARIEAPTLGFDVQRGAADLRAAEERVREAPQVAALAHQSSALLAQLDEAKAELARAERLFAQQAITQMEVDRARTSVSTLRAQIAANGAQQDEARIAARADAGRQRAGVDALRARAGDTDVIAPIDGVVLARHVETGEVVTQSQSLLRVGDLRHLWIESRVDEADIGRVKLGMPAALRLYSFGGRTFKGKVSRVLPESDADRKSFEVDIDFDEPVVGLRPGMTAEVNLIAERHDAALLAAADAVHDGHVWVVQDGRLGRRAVEVGIRDLTRVEILRGLAEGDRVVLDDEANLRDGMKVVERPAAAAGAGTGKGR